MTDVEVINDERAKTAVNGAVELKPAVFDPLLPPRKHRYRNKSSLYPGAGLVWRSYEAFVGADSKNSRTGKVAQFILE